MRHNPQLLLTIAFLAFVSGITAITVALLLATQTL
jgi:hypothetical protein